MTATNLSASYFDGHSAVSRPVTLTIDSDRVVVDGDGVHRDEPLGSVTFSERMGRTPRFVRFSDNAFCETTDVDTLQTMLARAGIASDRLSIWEQNPNLAIFLSAVMVVLVVAGYRYGLPYMAKAAAERVPAEAVASVSRQVHDMLDSSIFETPATPQEQRVRLIRRFAAMDLPVRPETPLIVLFRSSEALGPNALALPSGTILVTDDLVRLAKSDDEVLAVLAHEAGHVYGRHGLRNIIQSSVVSILLTWYIGDVSGLVAAAPTALLEAKYSRDLEREADDYAASVLESNGMSASLLADVLERMDAAAGHETRGIAAASAYLGSHPTTSERLDRLRGR